MIGTMLLHYRIIRELGRGGMGVVYLAQDTKLDRPVALKMLPPALRSDPKRLARFHTEAKAAAKLNHPNIATIYDVDEVGDLLFITMEFVDGQPLTYLLPQAGLLLPQFFTWFVPLADALCHAHERGVRHRDFKPGNIMVSTEGVPKILDFGLAQITRPEPEEGDEADSEAPTKSVDPERRPLRRPGWLPGPRSLTEGGEIMGTPSYMSPQQAEGRKTDHRTDIFSFEVVLYEALTGWRPFVGESVEAIIGRILTAEPEPVTSLRREVPYLVGRLITNCLQKDLKRRVQSMVDVRRELEDVKKEVEAGTVIIGTAAPRTGVPAVLRRWPVLAAAVVLLAALVTLAIWFLKPVSEPPLRTFQLSLAARTDSYNGPVISPDGTMIVFTRNNRLWVHDLAQGVSRELPGTDGGERPFWSPDNKVIGYVVVFGASLRTIAVQGGSSTPVCTLPPGRLHGGTWTTDGEIVFGMTTTTGGFFISGTLYRVPAQGGTPRVFLQPDSTRGELGFIHPQVLPDGQTLLYALTTADSSGALVVQVGDTRTVLVRHQGERLAFPWYSPSGHIVYQRGFPTSTSLWAIPFDVQRRTRTGEPFHVATPGRLPSVSREGTLVYTSSTIGAQLVWVDRAGRVTGTIGQPQEGITSPALSPDGRLVAVGGQEQNTQDIWLHDVERGTKTRLSYGLPYTWRPSWSPTGDRIVFQSVDLQRGQGDIYIQATDSRSPPQPLVKTAADERAPRWSPDGRFVLYSVIKPVGLVFPDGNGGVFSEWRGGEIFYVDVETNMLMVARVRTRPEFRAEQPQSLFTGEQVGVTLATRGTMYYTVSSDGQRFVVVQDRAQSSVTLVQN